MNGRYASTIAGVGGRLNMRQESDAIVQKARKKNFRRSPEVSVSFSISQSRSAVYSPSAWTPIAMTATAVAPTSKNFHMFSRYNYAKLQKKIHKKKIDRNNAMSPTNCHHTQFSVSAERSFRSQNPKLIKRTNECLRASLRRSDLLSNC